MKRQKISKQELDKEIGAAIIGALWLSLVLALLALALISMSRDSVLEIKTKTRLDTAWDQAESGISIAKYNIGKRQNRWFPRQSAYSAKLGDKEALVDVYVSSPLGKLDINYASPALLSQLFQGLGYEREKSVQMADRIADWRDPDDLTRLNGAEVIDYTLTKLSPPSNEPFRDVQDIRLVLGISPADANCLSPFLTVYAQSANLQPSQVTGILRSILSLPEAQDDVVRGYRRSSLAGQIFEVIADVQYSEQAKVRVKEIFRYTGIPSDPIWIHHQSRTIVSDDNLPYTNIPNACPSQTSIE